MEIIKQIKYLSHHKLILILVISASILTLINFIFDGQYGCINNKCGFIIGTNYRDGVWFLAVANTAFKTFPFQMPIYSGESLSNYHYLPNLFTYLFSLLGIPVFITYYKIIPIFYFIAITILSLIFARKIKDDPKFVFLFLFFTLFGISLTIITSLYHLGRIDNGLLINTFQSTRLLESPHTALSFLIIMMILIINQNKQLTKQEITIQGILLFVILGIKFYGAVAAILLVIGFEFIRLIKTRKIRSYLLNNSYYLICIFLSLIAFYNLLSISQQSSVFIWSPFATVHHLIESPNMFYLPNMVNARYFLYAHGWSPRLLAIELLTSLIFICFYFGTKTICFIYLLFQFLKRRVKSDELVILITIIILLFLSIFFIQKGDWFNPIQFAVVAAFL